LTINLAINGRFASQPTTGVQRVAREITREIDTLISNEFSDFRVRLICDRRAALDDLDLKNVKVERVAPATGHAWEQLVLPLTVGDAVLLCMGNTAPVISLLGRRPVSVMIHDLSYRLFPDAYRTAYRAGHALLLPFLLRRANPLITVSKSEQAMMAGLHTRVGTDVLVAQNGGWREHSEDREGDEPNPGAALPPPGFVLYLGAFTHRKNLPRVLEVAIRLAREDGLRFLFVGSAGSIHTSGSLTLPDDVRDKIVFMGHVESANVLAEVYRRASCLVFPSLYEASPLPPLEAMHFACPVVASNIPAMVERCGDAAEYCDPTDVDSISAAVRRVIHDKARSDVLVARGLARVKLFSWRQQARTILEAIRRSCGQGSPAHPSPTADTAITAIAS
jgi:glycosyltransferase involved in cell wall biosynthesis